MSQKKTLRVFVPLWQKATSDLSGKFTFLLFITITIGPFIAGLVYSLLYSLGLIGLMSKGFTLDHWMALLHNPGALSSLWYTLLLAVVSLLAAVSIALGIAWRAVYKSGKSGRVIFLFLPLLIPPLIAGFAWYYLLSPTGFLGRVLWHLGVINSWESMPRLVNDAWSVGIIVTHVFLIFPLFSLLFMALARKENMKNLLMQGQNLGATKLTFFWKVYVPVLLWKSKPFLWLYGVFLIGTYEVPLLLGRSSPQALSVFISDKLMRFDLATIPVAHAMAVLYSLFVLMVVTVFIRKKALELF